ncbi:type I glutamate--ammonia ligase [Candidatus Caldatribacterium sp.]|uniref:type I glutamate--ammonia ligase n=1 Tax=Candidatus Caldatribacterium sp. TaxID=2282143 RepID=UPI002995D539|nr:type I glutamate--ammonia ligase [Candidatus Caldatribacterium sp.]MDW8080727.1 type I glutamate--ammonia ligase [Candidatus Calescibacterium sp.]
MQEIQDILKEVEKMGIRFVRLQFVDVLGIPKNVEIPVKKLPAALEEGVNFDGSSIQGFVRIEESDMKLVPDLETFIVCPWEEERVARVICDVCRPDGSPFEGCPRTNLKRVLKEAEEKGYEFKVGTEAEFFILKYEQGRVTTSDHGSYFDLLPLDLEESLRRDMVIALEELGFRIEASHHEVAPSQHEIDFEYGHALKIADNLITLKLAVKTLALRKGYVATFMPKPLYGVPGSGMHTHLSLFRGEENLFYDPHSPDGLSRIAKGFIAGLLEHAPAITAITNPLVNSYKRLVPGYEAPVYIAWAEKNRSPLVRVPPQRGKGTRAEFRSPDPSCNPYLAFAVILKAGIDGIERSLDPGRPCNNVNLYDLTCEEREEWGIRHLPRNLEEALMALEKDEVVKSALTPHILDYFLKAKRQEWEEFQRVVHPWEIERYLELY